jgi:hypothetical protein
VVIVLYLVVELVLELQISQIPAPYQRVVLHLQGLELVVIPRLMVALVVTHRVVELVLGLE